MIAFVITAVIVIILLLLAFIFFPIINRFLEKKFFKKMVAKKLYKSSVNDDVFLINDVVLNNDKSIKFDHMYFGQKFIFCIKDLYVDVGINGSAKNNLLFNYDKKGKKTFIENPLMVNDNQVSQLWYFLRLRQNNLIYSIVCINDSASMDVSDFGEKSFIVKKKDLIKTIKKLEKDTKIVSFKKENEEKIVKKIYNMVEKNKE